MKRLLSVLITLLITSSPVSAQKAFAEKKEMNMDSYQSRFVKTPSPPYYSVVFTIQTTDIDKEGFAKADERMLSLAADIPGFIGAEGIEDSSGFIIFASYWKDLQSIRQFRENAEHRKIQTKGQEVWFQKHTIRVAQVIKEYGDEM